MRDRELHGVREPLCERERETKKCMLCFSRCLSLKLHVVRESALVKDRIRRDTLLTVLLSDYMYYVSCWYSE